MWNQPRHLIRTALLGPKTGRLLIANAPGDDAVALRDAVAALA
jgi:hypothetical protein